jgi:hypothetical protein
VGVPVIKGGSEDVVVFVVARGGDMVGGEAVMVAMMTDKIDKKSGRQRMADDKGRTCNR